MRTIDKIIPIVSSTFGAPMGRANVGIHPHTNNKFSQKQVFDCAVPMDKAGYDKGGAYWGYGKQLRVQYTKDLSYIRFYRLGD